MKRIFLTFTIVCLAMYGISQENMLTISGGYSFTNIQDSEYFTEDPNIKGTGWRINGTYDFNANEENITYGISVGYISVGATYNSSGDTVAEYKVNSVPFYFAPKYLFGNDKFNGFLKLAIGAQSANLKRTGTAVEASAKDFGFYGGGGAGLLFYVSESVFLNAEYEIAYMTNSFYRNGVMNSAMLGIGMKF